MTLTLVHLLALLFLGAFATAATTALRPTQARLAALLGLALLALAWLVARTALPLSAAIGSGDPAWPLWTWRVGELGWSVSLAVLLLSLGALAFAPAPQPSPPSAPRRAAQPLLIHVLAFLALLACWAENLATVVLAWTLLDGVWLLALTLFGGSLAEQVARLPARLALPLAAILFLWLAAAVAGPGAAVAQWPTLTRSLVLLAATCQLLIFPFYLGRALIGPAPGAYPALPAPAHVALLHAAPAAAGALLLARLESASDIGLAFALPFTLLGLALLLIGAHRAWTARAALATLPLALIQAQSGLVLLVAIWAGPQAVLAETAVLLLAGGVLLLANGPWTLRAAPRNLQPGPLIALAALAALPLTAGFAGRSALYDAWLANGRWLLVLVTALLHVPLLTAAFKSALPANNRPQAAPQARAAVARVAALLLPALGLLSFATLAQASLAAWLATLLPTLLAALLAWRLEETAELRQALREAFTVPLPARPSWLSLRRPAAAVSGAAREALTLLEGEGGLLWLLVFVVILYLVR